MLQKILRKVQGSVNKQISKKQAQEAINKITPTFSSSELQENEKKLEPKPDSSKSSMVISNSILRGYEEGTEFSYNSTSVAQSKKIQKQLFNFLVPNSKLLSDPSLPTSSLGLVLNNQRLSFAKKVIDTFGKNLSDKPTERSPHSSEVLHGERHQIKLYVDFRKTKCFDNLLRIFEPALVEQISQQFEKVPSNHSSKKLIEIFNEVCRFSFEKSYIDWLLSATVCDLLNKKTFLQLSYEARDKIADYFLQSKEQSYAGFYENYLEKTVQIIAEDLKVSQERALMELVRELAFVKENKESPSETVLSVRTGTEVVYIHLVYRYSL